MAANDKLVSILVYLRDIDKRLTSIEAQIVLFEPTTVASAIRNEGCRIDKRIANVNAAVGNLRTQISRTLNIVLSDTEAALKRDQDVSVSRIARIEHYKQDR